MAPEQIDGVWGRIGPHTDIYSLGAVLYFLLTGSPPVGGARISDVFEEVTSAKEIPAVSTLRPDVPSGLAAVCRRCLQKSPEDRYQSTERLIEALL